MSFKQDIIYYTSRLKDPNLLLKSVKVRLPKDYFYCVPCGGSRVTGFTHMFNTLDKAEIVKTTILANSGNLQEDFPNLRIKRCHNAFDKPMFYLVWGLDEPIRITPLFSDWGYEVAIVEQLGYSKECMLPHAARLLKFEQEWAPATCHILFNEIDKWVKATFSPDLEPLYAPCN